MMAPFAVAAWLLFDRENDIGPDEMLIIHMGGGDVFQRAGALRDPSLVVDVLHRAMTEPNETVRDDMALAVIALR